MARGHRAPLLLYLVCACAYLLSASGEFGTIDGEFLFRVTDSLFRRGTLAIACDERWPIQTVVGRGGACYSLYGLGQSVALVPLYLLGRGLERLQGGVDTGVQVRFLVSFFNTLVTPLTVVVLHAIARALYSSGRTALGVASLYAFATLAWPYSGYLFAHPLTLLFLLLAFHSLLRSRGREWPGERRELLLAGSALGMAQLVRIQANLMTPVLAGYLLATRRGPAERRLRALVIWALAYVPWLGASALYNSYRFGVPLDAGYLSFELSTPLQVGLLGMLLSPGKGLFLYSPLLLLGVAGLWRWLHEGKLAEAWVVLGSVLAYGSTHAVWFDWSGGTSWGPRFLYEGSAFLTLPVGAMLHRATLIWGLGLLSAGIQLLGVLTPLGWPLEQTGAAERLELYFTWGASPVLWSLRYLRLGGPLEPALDSLSRWGLPSVGPWIAGGLTFMGMMSAVGLLAGTVRDWWGSQGRRGIRGALLLSAAASLGAAWLARPETSPDSWAPAPRVALVPAEGVPPASALRVSFGELLELLGAEVLPGGERLSPGEAVIVDTYWRALEELGEEWKLAMRWVETGSDLSVAQEDLFMGRFPLETASWYPGEVHKVRSYLAAPHGLPAGRYGLRLRVYSESRPYPLPIREYPDRVPDFDTPVFASWRLAAAPLAPRGAFEPIELGSHLRLVSVEWLPGVLRPGAELQIRLKWEGAGESGSTEVLFLHLLDARGWRVAQVDEALSGRLGPAAGPTRVSAHLLRLPENLPPGNYRLLAGIYDLSSGERLPALRAGLRVWGDAVELLGMEVQGWPLAWP